MSLPRELLVAVSVLSSADRSRLQEFANLDPALVDTGRLDQAIDQAVDDRVAFAREFHTFGATLLAMSAAKDDMAARNAVARTYYAAHHAIRAVALYRSRADEYDHRGAIKAFGKLVDDNPFLGEKLKEILAPGSKPEEVRGALVGLLDTRHAADYHSYGSLEPKHAATDFAKEAADAQQWVGRLIDKIETYVTERRAGKFR